MRLESVTLKNFRAYTAETHIRVGDLTTIIGQNDVGKSSVLDALEIFFNNETVKLEAADCNVRATEKVIEITCEFSDQQWVNKHYLKGLGRPEVHIYDRDVKKYGDSVKQVNQRTDGSWAVQTKKLEIENYLHPDAIDEGLQCAIKFGDQDDVPALVGGKKGWNSRNAKRKLATQAFPKMTAERIGLRDPQGEIRGWLVKIAAMFK